MKLSVKLTIILLFVFNSHFTFAQESVLVKGVVYDAASGKTLPYVNISVKGESMGCVSNKDGFFLLKISEDLTRDTLIISHIGFGTYKNEIFGMQDSLNSIYLNPVAVELASITVLPVSGVDIVRDAITSLPENCVVEPFNMTGFYRELIREKEEVHKYAEGVINIYREFRNKDRIKLIKGRNRENLKAFEVHKKADPTLGGPINCFYRDITNYNREFFNEENFKYYDYSIEGITGVNDKQTYIIYFDKKPESKKGIYKGRLYIDQESGAVIKTEFQLNDLGMKKSQPDAVQRSLAKLFVGITFESGGSFATVNYTEIDGKWYLKSIQYKIIDILTRKEKVYHYVTEKELMISGITTSNVNLFDDKELLNPGREFSNQVGEYDESFWENYNIIQATDSEKDLIGKME